MSLDPIPIPVESWANSISMSLDPIPPPADDWPAELWEDPTPTPLHPAPVVELWPEALSDAATPTPVEPAKRKHRKITPVGVVENSSRAGIAVKHKRCKAVDHMEVTKKLQTWIRGFREPYINHAEKKVFASLIGIDIKRITNFCCNFRKRQKGLQQASAGAQNYRKLLENAPRKLIDVDMEGADRLQLKMHRMRKQKLIEFNGVHTHIHRFSTDRSLLQYNTSDELLAETVPTASWEQDTDIDGALLAETVPTASWEQDTDIGGAYSAAIDVEQGIAIASERENIDGDEDVDDDMNELMEEDVRYDSVENSTYYDDISDGDNDTFEAVHMDTPWGDDVTPPPIRTSEHGDMDIYDGFVRVPITDGFIVRRRHLLQNQNSSAYNGDIIDLLGTTAVNSVTPLTRIPRNESEVMNYVGVIFAALSSLAAISGICFHRRITYVTVNHHRSIEEIENKIVPIQPVTKSIPINKQPLLQKNEYPTEMYLKVDSFL
ncbi:hypothetical protein T484DRAFT_1757373 [Baffinella frigidus]|nr:hypothetical protein T484DRAFT_1757373 [Cryptophyta sp. CCMP2293]